jgi:hypothetical protein
MTLPILNDKPQYNTIIPSTGEKVSFRPYLVKEEKILLIAMESQDTDQIFNAISSTVLSCIPENINVNTLTTFDIEFLFMKIRSKSVGEKAPLLIKCSECNHENEIVVNLDNIDVLKSTDTPNFKIRLTDEVSLKMKYPSYMDVTKDKDLLDPSSKVEQTFSMVIQCMDAIQTEDESFKIKDTPKEEVMRFLESLTSDQYSLITDFMQSIPRLHHKEKFACEKCSHENEAEFNGIDDFF